MKKLICGAVVVAALLGVLACVYAAQDTAIERVEVRDPVRLEAYLEANAADAETRIAAVEAGIQTSTTAVGAMDVATNLTVGGTAAVTGILTANEHDAKTATALLLGKATATGVTIGASDADTTVAGDLIVSGNDIDSGAGAMTVGKATATSLALGASDINTSISGPLIAPVIGATTKTATTIVFAAADYGKLVVITNGASVGATLPANGAAAGSWFDVAVGAASGGGNDSVALTVSAATADTLITPNSVDSDSVTWGSGHRIGAYARFWSDGSFWHVLNLGGTTMTYTDSD